MRRQPLFSPMLVLGLLSSPLGCDSEHAAKSANKSPKTPLVSTQPSAAKPRTEPLERGDQVPNLQADGHTGQRIELHDYLGRPLVVYFCPDNRSPECETEAQEVRDLWLAIRRTQAKVFGVSASQNVAGRAFASEHDLPFLMLGDADGAIRRAFGVGAGERVTFIMDSEGEVAEVFRNVTPRGHGAQILKVLHDLSSS